jgi:hypothetical protein
MGTLEKQTRLTNSLLDRSRAVYRRTFRNARALWFWRVGGVPLLAAGVLGLAVELTVPRTPALAVPLSGSFNLADVGNTVAGATISGVADSDFTGLAVSGAGDVNGDGVDDFLVGSYGADASGTNRGETYLVYGQGGGNPLSGSLDLAALGSTVAGATFQGIADDDQAGRSVSGAGDVNGDGLADLLIGAWGGNGAGDNRGETYLVYGQGSSSPLSGAVNLANVGGAVAGATFYGAADSHQSGYSVSGAGDVNGDGIADLLIAGFGMSQGYLVYGQPNTSPLSGSLELHNVGAEVAGAVFNGINGELSVSGAGDVNGDGVGDILIGSGRVDSNRGETYLVYGQGGSSPLSGTVNLTDVGGAVAGATFAGTVENGFAGLSVSGGGDVNGDGMDDLLIGAMYANGHGETYLVYGQPNSSPLSGSLELADLGGALEGATFTGVLNGDHAGSGFSIAGDVNGDGRDDIVIGAWHAPGGSPRGESYLVYGQGGSNPLSGSLDLADLGGALEGATFEGIAGLGRSGRAISGAGDVNNDGVADFLIGAFTADGTGTDRGEAYLVYGQSGQAACDFTGDASCDTADIDNLFGQGDLVAGVSGTGSDYDLTGDGTLNGNDIAAWLAGAATENGHSSAYLSGDTDLDRDIDLTDYNVLAANFSPAGSAGLFSTGDGDGDGNVDLSDYNTLASNLSPTGYGTTAEVPEPSSLVFCLLGLGGVTGVCIARRH